jgi:putative transposase
MPTAPRNASVRCIHHSDRDVQYAVNDYIQILEEHQFIVSMSRKGNPYDNAQEESFMKTFKVEKVYVSEY